MLQQSWQSMENGTVVMSSSGIYVEEEPEGNKKRCTVVASLTDRMQI